MESEHTNAVPPPSPERASSSSSMSTNGMVSPLHTRRASTGAATASGLGSSIKSPLKKKNPHGSTPISSPASTTTPPPPITSTPTPPTTTPFLAWHAISVEDTFRLLETSSLGITDEEAAKRRDEIFGSNVITPAKKIGILGRLWAQVNNILILILLLAAVVSGFLAEWAEVGLILLVITINVSIGVLQEGKAEKAAEALKNMLSPNATVVRNGGIRKTVNAADLVPGDIIFIESGDRIPADVRFLDVSKLQVLEAMLTGESHPIQKNITPVQPLAPLGDRKCLGFSATLVMSGQGLGVVVETGDFAEIGKISQLVVGTSSGRTDLTVQLEIFGRWISCIVCVIAISTLLLAHLGRSFSLGESFTSSVAVAVAIIPEGLPAVVTIVLAIGTQRMASRNAIIKSLPAVETLGSITVICSDKTGTLTKNEMTVVGLCTRNNEYKVTGVGYAPNGNVVRVATSTDSDTAAGSGASAAAADNSQSKGFLLPLVLPGLLCNDGDISSSTNNSNGDTTDGDDGKDKSKSRSSFTKKPAAPTVWTPIGAPSEVAIVTLGYKLGLSNVNTLRKSVPRIGVVPFESEHKFMMTVHKAESVGGGGGGGGGGGIGASSTSGATSLSSSTSSNIPNAVPGETVFFVKGAPDRLIPHCMYQLADDDENAVHNNTPRGSKIEPIDAHLWESKAAAFAKKGLRVLAICRSVPGFSATPAFTALSLDSLSPSTVLTKQVPLVMQCLVAIMDPPREEAIAAIRDAHSAGISVKMITGDHRDTALAIGRMLHLVPSVEAPVDAGGNNSTCSIDGSSSSSSSSSHVIAHTNPVLPSQHHHHHHQQQQQQQQQQHNNSNYFQSSLVYTGPELDAMSDSELDAIVMKCNIYARASPENKIRIVKSLQRLGQTSSMTGDGVNDAPALKAANIGVAMGITGTDVSKEAAKMVLADDNFATIVVAVKEGRQVWDNLVKILTYNTPVNIAQGMTTFFALALGLPHTPLTAIATLYVNMITSVAMGMAFAFEPSELDIMHRPPRRPGSRLFSSFVLWKNAFVGLLIIVAVLVSFELAILDGLTLGQARAEAFTQIIFCEIAYVFNCRFLRSSSLTVRALQGNKWIFVSIGITAGLQVLIVYVPGLNTFFYCEPMVAISWARVIGFSAIMFFIVELEKYFLQSLQPYIHSAVRAVRNNRFIPRFLKIPHELTTAAAAAAMTTTTTTMVKTSSGSTAVDVGGNKETGEVGPGKEAASKNDGAFIAALNAAAASEVGAVPTGGTTVVVVATGEGVLPVQTAPVVHGSSGSRSRSNSAVVAAAFAPGSGVTITSSSAHQEALDSVRFVATSSSSFGIPTASSQPGIPGEAGHRRHGVSTASMFAASAAALIVKDSQTAATSPALLSITVPTPTNGVSATNSPKGIAAAAGSSLTSTMPFLSLSAVAETLKTLPSRTPMTEEMNTIEQVANAVAVSSTTATSSTSSSNTAAM